MSASTITPIILCGGRGTRLWPRSRPDRPKPFLRLAGDETLFEQTIDRCAEFGPPVIVTDKALVGMVEEQLGTQAEPTIIAEPESKSTAAAIALAANLVSADALILICPSDHYIRDRDAFVAAVRRAEPLAQQGWLVCIAAPATAAATGYGYMRRGKPVGDVGFAVAQFVEKPGRQTAESYLASGDYAWNTGIFVGRADRFLAELKRHRPEMADLAEQAVRNGRCVGKRFHPGSAEFSRIVAESVDYAVFENTDRAAMIVSEMGWSDVGNWRAVRSIRRQDSDGNYSDGRAQLVDCRNVLVDSDGARVVCIGLEDLVVAIDGDDILIATAERAADVGSLISEGDRSFNKGDLG